MGIENYLTMSVLEFVSRKYCRELGHLDIVRMNVVRKLRFDNIRTVGDLVVYNSCELLLIPGFGRKSLALVEDALRGRGLELCDREAALVRGL